MIYNERYNTDAPLHQEDAIDSPLSIQVHPTISLTPQEQSHYDTLDESQQLLYNQSRIKQYYFHRDYQNSVLALSDEEGNIIEKYTYDAFGTITSEQISNDQEGNPIQTLNPYRYTGREYDAPDLYYYRARYYDPTIGRFITPDPIGFLGGDINLYRYVGNDPVNFVDWSGFEGFSLAGVVNSVQETLCNVISSLPGLSTPSVSNGNGCTSPCGTDGSQIQGCATTTCEIIDAYFAENVKMRASAGMHTYSFEHDNNRTRSASQKANIAKIILSNIKEKLGGKYTTEEEIKKALTQSVYMKGQSVTFVTFKDKLQSKRINEAKIRLGELLPKQTKKFRDYADEYLKMKENEKSYDVKHPTRLKVIEYFGDKKVDEITRLDIKRYLNTLEIKEASKRLYLSMIKGVLDIALDDEAISSNVAVGIQFKRTEKIEVKPFSNEEVQTIIESAEGALKNYLGIAFYTGMRSGEILGLMHHDITEDTISIKRSVSKGRVTTPKTHGSIRTIPMFDKVRPFIEAQIKQSKSLYLFDYDADFISDISVFTKRRWHRLLQDLEIEYRKIYCTRHTFITAMLNSNQYKLLTVAKIVGHSSIKTLMTSYAGFIKDDHLKINVDLDIFRESSVKVTQMMKI